MFQLPVILEDWLLVAMAARAMYLITGDIHRFGRYFGKTIEGMLVLSPAGYLRKRRAY